MFHIKNSKHQVLHSLKIAKGHVQSIIEQVKDDQGCFEVIHQLRAVEKALHKVDLLLIQNHLLSHPQDEKSLQSFIDSLLPSLRDRKSSSLLNVPKSKINNR